MSTPLEKEDATKCLLDGVNELGGICLRLALAGQRGFPDWTVILPNAEIWFVELKRDRTAKSRLKPHQKEWHKTLDQYGQNVRTCYGVEDVEELVEWFGYRLVANPA